MTRKSAKRKAAPRKKGLVDRLRSLKDVVQDAIDDGATTVQQVHERVAAMPFDQLEKIAVLEGVVFKARGVHDRSVGALYDTIRLINGRIGELADSALNRVGSYYRP